MNNDELNIKDEEEKENFLIKEFDNIIYKIKVEFDEENIEITFECLDDIKEYYNKFTFDELQKANNFFKIFNNTEKLVSILKKLIMNNSSSVEFDDDNMILVLKSEELEEEIKFLLKYKDDINYYLIDFKKKIYKNYCLIKSLNNKFKENESINLKLIKENIILKENNYLLKEKVENLEKKINLLESKITSNSNISEKNIQSVFSSKSLINNNFSLKVLKIHKTLNINNNIIYCMKLLQDGRLAITAEEYKIKIFNLESFEPELILTEHVSNVNCIEQLNDGTLVSCSDDQSIILYTIKKDSYKVIQIILNHNDNVLKVRELKNKNLVSCSYDYTIKIWKKLKEKFEEINSFLNTNYVLNIYEIKENILISDCWNYTLNFWDLKLNKKILTVNNIILNGGYLSYGFLSDNFYELNETVLLYGGYGYIYLINRDNYNINTIVVNNVYNLCFCKISDNVFLNGNSEGNFVEWKNIENYNLSKIDTKNAHDKTNVRYIIKNENYIISCDDKGNINFWK